MSNVSKMSGTVSSSDSDSDSDRGLMMAAKPRGRLGLGNAVDGDDCCAELELDSTYCVARFICCLKHCGS